LLQASEGGSVSLGRRKFRSKSGATPTLKPKFEAAPNAIAGTRADNIPRAGAITPVSSPTATTAMPMVELSKTSLAGICLIAFACGIVTTVLVDRAVPRTNDRDAVARDPDALPLRTASAASGEMQETPARTASTPVAPPAPIFRAAAASAPVAARPQETGQAVTPASEGAVVVQMPSLGGPAKGTAHGAHAAAPHNAAHQHSSPTPTPPKGKRTVASAAKPPASAAAKPPVASAEKPAAASTTKPGAAKSVASASKAVAGKPPSRPSRSAGPPPKPGWIDPFSQ
jgi:hypothetical protein